MRIASAIASTCTPDQWGGFAVEDVVVPTPPRHQVASSVEVRTRYLPGQWAGGYDIAKVSCWVIEYGARVAGHAPDIFAPADAARRGLILDDRGYPSDLRSPPTRRRRPRRVLPARLLVPAPPLRSLPATFHAGRSLAVVSLQLTGLNHSEALAWQGNEGLMRSPGSGIGLTP